MTKPFPLQSILELMQERTDTAARQLARLIAAENDSRSRLEMLQQYRNEYVAKFTEAASAGLSPYEWANYQAFLGRLDEAVAQQTTFFENSQQHTLLGQNHWKAQRMKEKALDTLSQRHQQREQSKENRLDQKQMDEFAARRTLDQS